MATYSLDDVHEVCKKRDAWWTVLLVDPVAVRLTRLVANRTSITPNQLTLASFAMGLVAAGCFAAATPYWLALGALAYHVSFLLDCCDGKIARLKGTGTLFGPWLDYIADRLRVLCCTLALVGGQYVLTGREEFFYVGFAVLFLDMFRYLNTLHVAKTRRAMRAGLDAAAGDAGPLVPDQGERLRYVEDLLRAAPTAHPETLGDGDSRVVDLHRAFRERFPWYDRARHALQGRRVRTHVVSGVEFQMALFVLGPLTGLITPIAVAAGALLVVFELVIIYKLWLSTRVCEELIAEFGGARTGPPVTERPLSGAGVR